MLRICTALLVALFTASCGGASDLGEEEFVASYPPAYCAYLLRCCDLAERSHGSAPACELAVAEIASEIFSFRASSSPGATFDASAAKSCIDRLKTKKCGEDKTLPAGCLESAVVPQRKAGEACTTSVECTSFYCVQPEKGAAGSCGSAGSSQCSGDDRGCSAGSYCSGLHQCVPRLDTARPCSRPGECQSGICSSSDKICVTRTEPWCAG